MDAELARTNMITQQIKTWEVLDQRVLELFGSMRREDFIPDTYRGVALADTTLPIGHGQQTMTPKTEARLLQSVAVQGTDRVLEVGTGCAWLTALLAKQADAVTSVDIHPEFVHAAKRKLAANGIHNATLEAADIFCWANRGQFDVVVFTGSLPVLGAGWQDRLKPGGRLFAVVGKAPVMEAQLISMQGERHCAKKTLFETELPPLIGAPDAADFEF